eukprot:s1149_g4.t5
MAYAGVMPLPGAVDDSPVPGDSDLEMGLERASQRKKPQRNVVLTIEQKEKLQEWQQLAEHGFEIHRRAERYYEQVNFWTLSLPSVVLSAIATVWTLATEQTSFPNNRVYIASISGLTTIVSSVGSYWRWQARMEKNRFASERYNSLLNRLTLLKARLQMGDVDFSHVLQEVENTIHEILKTCGPPDLRIQQRFEWEEKTSQFELLDRLTTLRDSHECPWIRFCCPCCWRSCMKVCPCCKRRKDSDGVVQPMTILNQKIREFSKKTQDVSVDEFKDYFWQLFRTASNSNNLEMCKSLIKAVPNSLTDDGEVKFKSVEPSKKSPLHFSVQDNFHQLGQWLFETYPKQIRRHCLVLDCHSKIPLDYMPTEKNEWMRWNAVNSREGGGAAAFYTRLLFETIQQWCIEMSDLHSFEDKERMKGHGKELCRRIKLFSERHSAAHVDIACPKRHTVLHLLAVHGVEEREPLQLGDRSDRESEHHGERSHRTLLSLLIHADTGFGSDTIDTKDSAEHKAPLELAAEQRHARAFKMLLELMLMEMHELEVYKDQDSKKADRAKNLKDVVENSLNQLHKWPSLSNQQKGDKDACDSCDVCAFAVEEAPSRQLYFLRGMTCDDPSCGKLVLLPFVCHCVVGTCEDCCSCSPAARFERLERINPREAKQRMADFAHMKIQRSQDNGESYHGTLLHLACGAEDLIDIIKLTLPKQDSLAKLLLEANASNSLDNFLGTVGTASKPVSRTPLRWAIEKGHWRITWDICKYGVSNRVKDIVEDIEHCLQTPAEEFDTFWLCQDSTGQKITQRPQSEQATNKALWMFQLWLYFSNGTKICLKVEDEDTVEQADAMTDAMEAVTHRKIELGQLGGLADKSFRVIKGMKEHRLRFTPLKVPVAPVAFRLETTEEHADITAGRAGFRLKASGQKHHRHDVQNETVEEPQLLIENMPLKEWVLTQPMKQRQKFMNNDDGGYDSNRQTLWHLACTYRNVPLAKQLLEHSAHYAETGTGETPLDLVGSGDSMREDALDHQEDAASDVASPKPGTMAGGSPTVHRLASAAGSYAISVDEESRELARLLIFLDYRIKLDRDRKRKEQRENDSGYPRIVERYHRQFHLDERAMILMRDHDDKVLLHYAAMYGHYADVEWLLQHGAQVVVYDQLAFHDFRVTIVKPSKPELEKAYITAGGDVSIPFPEFCWRKTVRNPPTPPSKIQLQDMPTCLGMRQESVSEMVTWQVGFERPERLDGFRWSRQDLPEPDMPRSLSSKPNGNQESNRTLRCWALEARSGLEGLPGSRNTSAAREEWVLLNLELEGFNIEHPFDFEKGDLCELHTQRTPLDYALELSGLFSDGATDETHAARHSTVCKLLIDEALKGERQQEGRRGTLMRQTLASYCRPCVRVRTLSKALVDLNIKEEGIAAEPSDTTLLHVASKHGLIDVCSELVRRGCMFKYAEDVGNQSPLDVAMNDQVHESLIESIQTRIANADERALGFLRKLKSQNKTLWRILRLTNPHEDNYGIIDYAAMFGLRGFLKDIMDRIAVEIEDDQPVSFRAELIGTALPRYSNSKKLIDDIRKLLANNVDSDVWKKAKLKTLLAELDGIEEEEEKLSKVREHQMQFYHLASIATEEEAVAVVKLLLKDDRDKLVKLRDPVDNTALHLAADRNNDKVVKLLCDSKAHTEVMNMHQERPLHLAARMHSYESVKYLLDSGALPHFCNSSKETPLHLLTKNLTHYLSRQPSEVDFYQVMQILIDRLHGDKDHLYLIEKDSNTKTALDYLIQTDHPMACDPIAYLVQKLPDSMRNGVILNYIHTLTLSKTSCSHEIIKALFSGVDAAEVPKLLASRHPTDHFTPLQRSAWKGHADTTRVILDSLGSVASKQSKEYLHKALQPGPAKVEGGRRSSVDDSQFAELSYDEGELKRILDEQFYTLPPLRLAAKQNHVEATKELARRWLEVFQDENGINAIMDRDLKPELDGDKTATLNEEVQRVIKLGDQSLLAAVKAGDKRVVQDILTQNRELAESCKDAKGNSPLHYALDLNPSDQIEMCKLLLANNCSLAANQEGKTPLFVLCERRAQMMWKAEDSSYKIDYDPNDPIQRVRTFDERSIIVLEELNYENQHDVSSNESDELGKDMLAVDIELTQKILTSALERKPGNSLEEMLRAESGGKTVFDILSHGLENAAFHEWTHVLNKFLRLAWLKPLKSQAGDFKIPGKLDMTLLALAVLVHGHEVQHFLDSGDPLEVIWGEDTPFYYALHLRRIDLVEKMLARLKRTEKLQRLVEVLNSHDFTNDLVFWRQDIVEMVVETLPGPHLVEFLRHSNNLDKCFKVASPRIFDALRVTLGSEALNNVPESVSEWRFGTKAWTLVHILASIGDLEHLEELCKLLDSTKLSKVLNAKDKDGNSPLHHVTAFLGCIHVRNTSVQSCQGCFFPQKASDKAGSLYYKKFGTVLGRHKATNVYIRCKHDFDQLRWEFESDFWASARFDERYFKTCLEVKEDEIPMNKLSWKALRNLSDVLDGLDDWKRNTDKAPPVARLLIEARADIESQNRRGRTPLQECLLKPALKRFQAEIADLSVVLMGELAPKRQLETIESEHAMCKVLLELRDTDGLNAVEAASNIPWFDTVWRKWLKSSSFRELLKLRADDFCKPLNVALEHGWHLPLVRRVQTVARLAVSLGSELGAEQVDIRGLSGLKEPGFSSCLSTCLLQQSERMLKNITCNNLPDLAKIWLVPEPLDETKPLYSCRIHRPLEQDHTIEVDFMDIVENTSPCLKSAVGSVDVSIGLYRNPFLAEMDQDGVPKFFLNGVRGECQGPSTCLQVMQESPFRAVGLPGRLENRGKFYYEVEVSSLEPIWWGMIGWATESFSRYKEGNFMGFAFHEDGWTEDPEDCEAPYFDPSQSTTWWDGQDTVWADSDVFGLAVDIDKGEATITKNGETIVHNQSLDLMGKGIFPFLHTTHRVRIKLRSCDWRFAEKFREDEYKSWMENSEPNHRLLVCFKGVEIDCNYHPWKLELRIETAQETFSKVFRAQSLLSTAIWKQCSENTIEVLRSRGCKLTLETLVTALRSGTMVQALRMHDQSMMEDSGEDVPLLQQSGSQDVEAWIFGAFLMYLRSELSEEDLLVVCQSFVALGASLVRMAGDYIDVTNDRDDDVDAEHPLDGVYVRCDDASDKRFLYQNLCRSDQYILYDSDDSEPMWKLGLTSEFLEGGQPPWYFKTPNLENSKLREVVGGKEKKPAADYKATREPLKTPRGEPLVTKLARGNVGRRPKREGTQGFKEPAGPGVKVKHFRGYLRDCIDELQKRLHIPLKNVDIYKKFRQEFIEEGLEAEVAEETFTRETKKAAAILR